MPTPASCCHVIDIALDPPLASARDARLWVEEQTARGPSEEKKREENKHHIAQREERAPCRGRPALVLRRVDGAGAEEERSFPLPMGECSSARLRRVSPPVIDVASKGEKIRCLDAVFHRLSFSGGVMDACPAAASDDVLTTRPSRVTLAGAAAEGIRAKLKKGGRTLRVSVPVRDESEEAPQRETSAGAEPSSHVHPRSSALEPPSAPEGGSEPLSAHLRDLDIGPGRDPGCSVVGPAGDRRVVATRDFKRGDVVMFEAPSVAVKVGEPVASRALARAFHASAAARGAVGGRGRRGDAGDEDASAREEAGAGTIVPHDWALAHRLLASGALRTRRVLEWVSEYVQADRRTDVNGAATGVGGMGCIAANGAGGADETDIAAEVAAEVGGGYTAEDVTAVHRVVCANAFALETTCTRLHYGAAFFQAAAYLNHSCDPNCLSLRLGGNMAVYAARDIVAGEELTHSYIPSHQLLLPRAARRPLLFFDCRCVRCVRDSNDDSSTPPLGVSEGLDLGPASPIGATALAHTALEIRTAAIASADPREVLNVFTSEALGARESVSSRTHGKGKDCAWVRLNDRLEVDAGKLEALRGLPHQAAIELLEPVLDAHWRAALEAGGEQGERKKSASPPDAAIASVAASVWRDAVDSLRRRAALEGSGVAAVAEQVYAAAEVSLYALEAAEGGSGGNEMAARRALMYLVSAHGDSLACAQEDTLCLRAMPSISAAAAPFERLLAEVAALRFQPPSNPAPDNNNASPMKFIVDAADEGQEQGLEHSEREAEMTMTSSEHHHAKQSEQTLKSGETMSTAGMVPVELVEPSSCAATLNTKRDAGNVTALSTTGAPTGPDHPEELIGLLGKPETDPAIKRYLDSLAKLSSLSSSPSSSVRGDSRAAKQGTTRNPPPPDVKKFPPATKYISHKALGVSLCFEQGLLDCVHVYAEGVDGFAGYRGTLPHDLRVCDECDGAPADCGRSVVERLGEPTSKGGTGRQIWMTYEHLGLKVDVAAVDWEDGGAAVRGVSLWSA